MKANKKKIKRGRSYSIGNDNDGVTKPPLAIKKGPAAASQVKTRKDLRKELRKAKKAHKHQYLLSKCGRADLVKKVCDEVDPKKKRKRKRKSKREKGNKAEHNDSSSDEEISDLEDEGMTEFGKESKRGEERLDPRLVLKKQEEKLKRAMEKVRRKRLIEDNEKEDRNISQLSKMLKLNKKATIPESFRTDGLDYVLEICEKTGDGMKKKGKSDSDEEDNVENEKGSDERENLFGSELDEDDDGSESLEEGFNDGESDDDGEEDDANLDAAIFGSESEEDVDKDKDNVGSGSDTEKYVKNKSSKSKKEKADDGVWEDIYGRLRSKDGAVLSNTEKEKTTDSVPHSVNSGGKYVPPMLRGNQAKREKIAKQLKGLLNRLSESNMHSIANQVEEMYMANSRNEMNQTLLELLNAVLVRHSLTPERVVLEHIMLIAILHANVGMEVGAFFIQCITQDFKSRYDSGDSDQNAEDKHLENVVQIIAFIYHFKVVDACLIYDILKFLGDTFSAKDVELILTILRSVGFRLRKDDPSALKELIIMLQQKASIQQASSVGSAKVKFMLEILMAIRNNNMNKIPNYDPSFGEHLLKILKSHLHPGNYVSEMKIGFNDLLNANKSGRWWIVGSAWAGNQSDKQPVENDSTSTLLSSEDAVKHAKLLKRARAQGMNTDTRRNVFCILMSAEDYMDAFEKLNHLDLRNNQDREIVHVTIYCCLQEKKFNPYYAFILSKFSSMDRKLMLALQYNLWDRLKDLKSVTSHQRTNLAHLLVHLINDKSLPLSTLKVIEYTEMDKIKLKFLKRILSGILMQKDMENLQEIFIKPALAEKLGLFRESLRLFLNHFMVQTSITTSDGSTIESNLSPEEMETLKQRYPSIFKEEVRQYAEAIGQRKAACLFSISQKRIFDWISEKKHLPSSSSRARSAVLQSRRKNLCKIRKSLVYFTGPGMQHVQNKSDTKEIDAKVELEIQEWIQSQHPKKMTSTEVRRKAKEIYRLHGRTEIECSYGWYRRFKSRLNNRQGFRPISMMHEEEDSKILTWVLQMHDENMILSHKDLQTYARNILHEAKPQFKASSGWALRFLKRNHVIINWEGIYDRPLPLLLESHVRTFQTQIKSVFESYSKSVIGCVDEIPLSFTSPKEIELESTERKLPSLKRLSIKNCDATVIIGMLADGTFLPPMVIVKGQLMSSINQVYNTPDSSVVAYYSSATELSLACLERWMELVWCKNVVGQSVLIFDSYNIHCQLKEKSKTGDTECLIIPPGCSIKLQPLNALAKAVFLENMEKLWMKYLKPNGDECVERIRIPSPNEVVQWVQTSYENTKIRQEDLAQSFETTFFKS